MTICGSTCRSAGKFFRDAGNTIFCAAAAAAGDARPPSVQTPTDCGIFQPALSVASPLPDASGVGDVSIPVPVVTCTGVPPATGTAQMCRRSMSFAFVQ